LKSRIGLFNTNPIPLKATKKRRKKRVDRDGCRCLPVQKWPGNIGRFSREKGGGKKKRKERGVPATAKGPPLFALFSPRNTIAGGGEGRKRKRKGEGPTPYERSPRTFITEEEKGNKGTGRATNIVFCYVQRERGGKEEKGEGEIVITDLFHSPPGSKGGEGGGGKKEKKTENKRGARSRRA